MNIKPGGTRGKELMILRPLMKRLPLRMLNRIIPLLMRTLLCLEKLIGDRVLQTMSSIPTVSLLRQADGFRLI